TGPLPVQDQEENPPLRGLVNATRTNLVVIFPHPLGDEFTATQRVALQAEIMHVIKSVDHRNINMLSDPSFFSVIKGVPKRGKGMDAGPHVRDSNTHKCRRTIRLSGHMHEPRKRL